jgi:D-alanine-D-alanine ligase
MSGKIAVLAGGRSAEREVSLLSGHRVHNALAERGWEPLTIDPAETPLLERLTAEAFDACYIALHGKEGEDGTVQRLLELIGLPYTGTRPFPCQVSFDKALAKEALIAAGVPTPPWAVIQADALRDLSAGHILRHVIARVGFPMVVKPSRGGSAMGLSFVEDEAELPAAVMGALSFCDSCIVERRILGTEVTAGFIGAAPDELPLVEIVPRSGIYDYAARYTAGVTEYFAPARLDAEVTIDVARVALQAFTTLGLRGVGRTDLMIDAGGAPWVLEVNISPGMTEMSLLPMAAQAAGIPIDELCDRVLRQALGS